MTLPPSIFNLSPPARVPASVVLPAPRWLFLSDNNIQRALFKEKLIVKIVVINLLNR